MYSSLEQSKTILSAREIRLAISDLKRPSVPTVNRPSISITSTPSISLSVICIKQFNAFHHQTLNLYHKGVGSARVKVF